MGFGTTSGDFDCGWGLGFGLGLGLGLGIRLDGASLALAGGWVGRRG